MPSILHTAKRPYAGVHSQNQASITSYFPSQQPPSSAAGYSTSSLSSSSDASASPLSPPLPASVQANLLSVGMRVRKSVPEGYKTGGYSAFALFQDNMPAQHKAVQQQQLQQQAGQRSSAGPRRELTPFCGLLKVGGLAQQVVNNDVLEEEDLPFLSSQSSTISDVSVSTAPGKRRFDDSDDEEVGDVQGLPQQGGWQDNGSVSPKSRPVARAELGERPMAVPMSRRRAGERKIIVTGLGDGNAGMDLDFDEAEFLDYAIWERDAVDMSDV